MQSSPSSKTRFIELQAIEDSVLEDSIPAHNIPEDNIPEDEIVTRALLHEEEEDSLAEYLAQSWQAVKGDVNVAVKYVISDTKKHRKGFAIGIFTVFIVVMFISLLQNSIYKSPIVFLKLSEDQVGEYDMVMTGTSSSIFVNYSEVSRLIKPVHVVKGLAPRWVALGTLTNGLNQRNSSLAILAIDSVLEKKIGLGRSWHHKPLQGNQMHVSGSVLRRIGIEPDTNSKVSLVIDILGILQNIGGDLQISPKDIVYQYVSNATGIDFTQNISVPNITQFQDLEPYVNITDVLDSLLGPQGYDIQKGILYPMYIFDYYYEIFQENMIINSEITVVDAIEDPKGKFPKAIGNVGILESKFLQELLVESLHTFTSSIRGNLTIIMDFAKVVLEPLGIHVNTSTEETILQVLNQIDQFGNTTNLNDYAQMVIVMNRNRVKDYTAPYNELTQAMADFTNDIADGLGTGFPASFQLPIYTTLRVFRYTKVSLSQIFNCVAFVMLFLGGMLIYSLMLNDVEAKTYEYGMLRSLGMRQYVLIELLFLQSLYFSVPGILAGLLFGWLAYVIVAAIVASYVTLPIDVSLASSAVVLAVLLGFFMPVISNIFPIRRALTRTLRDALDLYHQVRSETSVRIQKLESLGLDLWQICTSVAAVAGGFVVYYMIPYAFIYRNLELFFGIMSGILVGMLLGLALIAQTLQPFFEKIALQAIMWGHERRALLDLTRKNLFAHFGRNIKTALMFTTCLTFVIFAGTVFSLQGYNVSEIVQLGVGSDIYVMSPNVNNPLPEADLRSYLVDDMNSNPNSVVTGFTFVTYPLSWTRNVRSTTASNLALFPGGISVHVVGVEEQYLDDTYVRFYNPTEIDTEFKYEHPRGSKADDAIRSLYINAGQAHLPMEREGIAIPSSITPAKTSAWWVNNITHLSNFETYTHYIDAIASEALREGQSIDLATPMRLRVGYVDDAYQSYANIVFLVKLRAMVSRVPGFLFSSYSIAAMDSPMIVSMDSYIYLRNKGLAAVGESAPTDPPEKRVLLVKTKSSASLLDREGVINGLRNYLDDESIVVTNTLDVLKSTKVAVDMLNLFFYIVSILAVVLCFFVLWLSFTANVNENSWEFGVLRSIGLTAARVIRVYIYEALAIIIASVVSGFSIGILSSITLTLQFNLFTELPFSFDFPYLLSTGVVVMSVCVAVLGSYIPATGFKRKPISAVLKGQ